MLIVTNRNLTEDESGNPWFGGKFNEEGPDELRIATPKRVRGGWKLELHGDTVSHEGRDMPASERAFLTLQKHMGRKDKSCLFFVHGFNNDLVAVLDRARQFERNYGVEVIAFTWPANGRDGGGLVGEAGGALSYKSDKRDAVRSVMALDRTLEKLGTYFGRYAQESQACHQRVSLLMHSMGNYLFKHLMKSSVYQGETALFDNVILAAADVNNAGHGAWLDRVSYRRRLYVTINESDKALLASRLKLGDKQRARLGHHTQNLESRNALYLDFTNARHVGDSHSYFEGEPIAKNANAKRLFHKMVNGQPAEPGLEYNVHSRTYQAP